MSSIATLRRLLLAGCCLIIFACSKNAASNGNPSGCISREQPKVTDRLLNDKSYDSVIALFAANHRSLDTLQPVLFYTFPPFPTNPGLLLQQINTVPFLNGLPVYNRVIEFTASNGLIGTADDANAGPEPESMDTFSRMSLRSVYDTFMHSNPDSYANTQLYGFTTVPQKDTHWADSCVVATLMYFRSDLFHCCDASQHITLSRGWNIHTETTHTPLAIIDDASGKIYPTIYETLYGGN